MYKFIFFLLFQNPQVTPAVAQVAKSTGARNFLQYPWTKSTIPSGPESEEVSIGVVGVPCLILFDKRCFEP